MDGHRERQHDASPTRTSRRSAILGTLGAAGAALAAGGVALWQSRSFETPHDPDSPDPAGTGASEPPVATENLPEFTRLPRSDVSRNVTERDVPEGAQLFLVSYAAQPADMSNESIAGRWISIVRYGPMWHVPESTAALAWLTPDEATDLAEASGIDSVQLVDRKVMAPLRDHNIGWPSIVATTANQEAIAAHWQRRFADQPMVRALVVEGEFPVGGVRTYPAAGQVLIESSYETLPDVLREIARCSDVSFINQGGIRMEFYCPPCGQG